MLSIGGPKYTKGKLLASVSSSIMLYGAQYGIRSKDSLYLQSKCAQSSMQLPYYDAICVTSSMISIELLAQEQADLYAVLHLKKKVERENTIKKMPRLLELVH